MKTKAFCLSFDLEALHTKMALVAALQYDWSRIGFYKLFCKSVIQLSQSFYSFCHLV